VMLVLLLVRTFLYIPRVVTVRIRPIFLHVVVICLHALTFLSMRIVRRIFMYGRFALILIFVWVFLFLPRALLIPGVGFRILVSGLTLFLLRVC